MVNDMTRGAPLKLIAQFFFPLMIGNIFQQLYNLSDMLIVGRFIGVHALAAVGATGSLSFFVLGFVLGLSSGFAIPVARYFGSGDEQSVRRSIVNIAYLSIICMVILTTVALLTLDRLLSLMHTPADIYDDAYTYIKIIFAGMSASMFYNMLANIARALGDSRTPFYFLLIASALNIGLDLLFIIPLQMGVAGAGYATVISQGVAAALCLIYMRKRFAILRFHKEDLHFDIKIIAHLLHMGMPMALQTSITAFGTMIIQIAINPLGSGIVAAVTIATRVQGIVTQPLDALGITMATYCSQNLGAQNLPRISQGVRIAVIINVVVGILSGIIITLSGTTLARLFLDANGTVILPDVQTFLMINGLMQWALAILFILRNTIQGLGFSIPAMASGAFELLARLIVCFFLVDRFGYLAICFASPLAWIFALALLIPLYHRAISILKQKIILQA